MITKTGSITIDGGENILHPATEAKVVFTSDGTDVESALTSLDDKIAAIAGGGGGGGGDNVHVGFIPDEGYLGIDYANSTDDLPQSHVAYRTIDLATQVANNVEQIANLETRVAELESIVEGLLSKQQ